MCVPLFLRVPLSLWPEKQTKGKPHILEKGRPAQKVLEGNGPCKALMTATERLHRVTIEHGTKDDQGFALAFGALMHSATAVWPRLVIDSFQSPAATTRSGSRAQASLGDNLGRPSTQEKPS